jgi:two-component system NtrC family sensor kinase
MHVVAADDDLMIRRLIETALAQLGHTVTAVSDGESAWTAIARERPALAVLDWQMPGLDGLEVCRRIRASDDTSAAFVVVVTARDHPADLLAALEAGADDYLTKPVDPDQLRARLLIAGRRVMLDAERRAAVAELTRARWLAGVGEMAIALQHEVNNPLAALTLNAQLLQRMPGMPAEQREIAAEIVEQAKRITEVVRRISTMRDPQSVEYIRGSSMVDLGDAPA